MFSKKTAEKNENSIEENKLKQNLRKLGVYATRYYDAIVAIFIILIFILGFFFVINPKYKEINKIETYSQEDLEAEKVKLGNYLEKLNEYSKEYQSLSEVSRDRVNKVIPQGDYLENFFARVENITKKQGVIITDISIKDLSETEKKSKEKKSTETDGSLSEVQIVLLVSGIDYPGVKKLVSIFENNLRLMDVESIKFDIGAKTAEFAIISYFFKD